MTNKVSIIIASKYIIIQYTSRWYFDLHVQVYKSLHPCQYWECSKNKSGRFEVSSESSAATVDTTVHRLFWLIENIYWCAISKLQNWFFHQKCVRIWLEMCVEVTEAGRMHAIFRQSDCHLLDQEVAVRLPPPDPGVPRHQAPRGQTRRQAQPQQRPALRRSLSFLYYIICLYLCKGKLSSE